MAHADGQKRALGTAAAAAITQIRHKHSDGRAFYAEAGTEDSQSQG
jgi:hypothetical protein